MSGGAELVPALPDDVRRAALAAGHADIWHALRPPGPAVETAGGYVLHTTAGTTAWPPTTRRRRSRRVPDGTLHAPMPGTVLRVDVRAGPGVAEGEQLVVLEAMKMELAVSAPAAGTVAAVLVAAGDLVARGQALVELETR